MILRGGDQGVEGGGGLQVTGELADSGLRGDAGRVVVGAVENAVVGQPQTLVDAGGSGG